VSSRCRCLELGVNCECDGNSPQAKSREKPSKLVSGSGHSKGTTYLPRYTGGNDNHLGAFQSMVNLISSIPDYLSEMGNDDFSAQHFFTS
jgi:hypothetical protein